MTHTIEYIPLTSDSPGTQRSLLVHRFGTPGASPKVFVQAALHANETPGLLLAHHLIRQLITAERESRILGEILVVPVANPIGLSTNVLGNQIGRQALDGQGNFNRGWPDFTPALDARVRTALTFGTEANVAVIRSALREEVAKLPRTTEFQSLHATLLGLAIDADLVIDVHCELDAVMEMVVSPWCWPMFDGLARDMRPEIVHLTEEPHLFETACSRPWHDLARLYPSVPIPQALAAITVEARGATHVDDATAAQDAAAYIRLCQRTGAIAGTVEEGAPWTGRAFAHEQIAMMTTPAAGVIVYPHPLGTIVEAGTVIAEIVDPAAPNPETARTSITAARTGLLFARAINRLVRPGDIVIKIAAMEAAA